MQRDRVVVAVVCVLVIVTGTIADAEDKLTAEITFNRAQELAQKGDFAAACPLYEASYRADPQIGVLLHLADCHERIGRTATAWAEFREAAARARQRGDAREALANKHAERLVVLLARVHIVPPEPRPAGMLVRLDGRDVGALVATDVPIDPGAHELEVSAPDAVPWKHRFTIETTPTTTRIEVPTLAPASKVAPGTDPQSNSAAARRDVPVAEVRRDEPSSSPASSSRMPLALGVGAVVLGGAALGLDLWARSLYDDAKAEQQNQVRRDDLYDSAISRRYLAQGVAVASVVTAGIAVWLYLRDRGQQPARSAKRRVIGVSPAGFAIGGTF